MVIYIYTYIYGVVREWGSPTMSLTGKFVYMYMYIYIYIYIYLYIYKYIYIH